MSAAEKVSAELTALVRAIVLTVLEEQRAAATVPANDEPKLVTRGQCAKALNISLATLDRAIKLGCPTVPVGRGVRFDVAAVRAWLDKRGRHPIREPKDAVPGAVIRAAGLRKRAS